MGHPPHYLRLLPRRHPVAAVAATLTFGHLLPANIRLQVCLFMVQKYGTHRISFAFSPIVTLWLLSLLGVGSYNLATYGGAIFQALNPANIVTLFSERGVLAWEALGGVMLTLTGKVGYGRHVGWNGCAHGTPGGRRSLGASGPEKQQVSTQRRFLEAAGLLMTDDGLIKRCVRLRPCAPAPAACPLVRL